MQKFSQFIGRFLGKKNFLELCHRVDLPCAANFSGQPCRDHAELGFQAPFCLCSQWPSFQECQTLEFRRPPEKLDPLPKLALVQAQDHVCRRAGSQVPPRCTFDWKSLGVVDERPMGQLCEVEVSQCNCCLASPDIYSRWPKCEAHHQNNGCLGMAVRKRLWFQGLLCGSSW